jgi:malonyl-CoA/methylmalonyl-CoA synthetase
MTDIRTVGVIGAGQMGAGIAQVAAQAGYDVILSDIDLPRAEKGLAGIAKLLARAVEKEKISKADADAALARIRPVGEIGVIEVKGPNVFKGYWRNPEKTKAEFREDGFFITGDLGKIDDKGYVHILGRGKDLVISGGFNAYPKEIESEIDAMPGVIESAVIGVPHADFGEGVTAVLVCSKGADVSEASVLKALDGRIAKFKMPKRVFVVDELPRNAMGKVQKNILRDTYKDIYSKA